MRTISLKLPEDLVADVEREAKSGRVTKSALMRQSLEATLRPRSRRFATSRYDLARDLATNPKYMEGFGEWRDRWVCSTPDRSSAFSTLDWNITNGRMMNGNGCAPRC